MVWFQEYGSLLNSIETARTLLHVTMFPTRAFNVMQRDAYQAWRPSLNHESSLKFVGYRLSCHLVVAALGR